MSDWNAPDLRGRVAVVTGATRGVGKGIALGLGDAGATVYVTGRTVSEGDAELPGSLASTAAEVSARGGEGIAVRCDHAVDEEIEALFARVSEERGRLDVLVNNVFCIPSPPMHGVPFWEQPLFMWDAMHRVGLRSHFVADRFAAPMMIEAGQGLIVHVSSFAGGGYALNVAYGVGKAGVDRLAADVAHELRTKGVCSVSLWPGIVRTEYILSNEGALPFDLGISESPELSGRAVAHLAADPAVMEQTGKVCVVAELAELYGFTDIDGSQPRSLRRPAKTKETR